MRRVSSSPHFHSGASTRNIMYSVAVAMMPSCSYTYSQKYNIRIKKKKIKSPVREKGKFFGISAMGDTPENDFQEALS